MILFLCLFWNKYKFLESEWELYNEDGKENYTVEFHYMKSAGVYTLTVWDDNENDLDPRYVTQLEDSIVYAAKFAINRNAINGTYINPSEPDDIKTFSTIVDEKGDGNYDIQVSLANFITLDIELYNESIANILVAQSGIGIVAKFKGFIHQPMKTRFRLSNSWFIYGAVILFLILQVKSMFSMCNQQLDEDKSTPFDKFKNEITKAYDQLKNGEFDSEEEDEEEEEKPEPKNTQNSISKNKNSKKQKGKGKIKRD